MLTFEIRETQTEFLIGYLKPSNQQIFIPMGSATTASMAEDARKDLQAEALERDRKNRRTQFVPGKPVHGFYNDEDMQ